MIKHDSSNSTIAGCEAIQQELSAAADSGEPLTPELRAHVDSCPDCAAFAEQWLAGPPAELIRQVTVVPDPELRDRILDAATRSKIVPFSLPITDGEPQWIAIIGRIAACVVLAGFAYWLLNPVAAPVRENPSSASAPTLTQGLIQMEDKSKHEQEILQSALVDGGRRVSGNVAWSMSALEL